MKYYVVPPQPPEHIARNLQYAVGNTGKLIYFEGEYDGFLNDMWLEEQKKLEQKSTFGDTDEINWDT